MGRPAIFVKVNRDIFPLESRPPRSTAIVRDYFKARSSRTKRTSTSARVLVTVDVAECTSMYSGAGLQSRKRCVLKEKGGGRKGQKERKEGGREGREGRREEEKERVRANLRMCKFSISRR